MTNELETILYFQEVVKTPNVLSTHAGGSTRCVGPAPPPITHTGVHYTNTFNLALGYATQA